MIFGGEPDYCADRLRLNRFNSSVNGFLSGMVWEKYSYLWFDFYNLKYGTKRIHPRILSEN